jgi:hypothetical protein
MQGRADVPRFFRKGNRMMPRPPRSVFVRLAAEHCKSQLDPSPVAAGLLRLSLPSTH